MCSFTQSFNVPTRMHWGFPVPPGLYIKLWKFLPLQNHLFTGKFECGHVCTSGSLCQVPLRIQKALFFLFSPNMQLTLESVEEGWDRGKLAAALCILALVTSSESELHQGKGSTTPLAVSTTTSQLRMTGAHLAHPGGSPPCSPLWKCICSTPGLVEEAFEHGRYKRRETGWRWG